ncbi:hypothetical protein K488DRAFT_69481 [Vararia minispora EC-137]|uniref:Uncharacterized protein n=1 Tax=Vararia minispora EC-137 TaxID=1314806 RepID=A0ACB8QQP3_9AGAM|nr:hypothetical protein K488DRAFT_69481 [Vararia minispora EC-137]
MVCIVAPAPAQTLSRSSSLKGIRSPRSPLAPNPSRLEHVFNPPQAIASHRQASVSPERRPAEPYEERITEALKELYSCSPSHSSFNVFAPNVVFRTQAEAVSIKGIDQLRVRFDDLHKKHPLANVLRFDVSYSSIPDVSNTILLDLEVEYFRDMNSSLPAKTCKGIVVLELSESLHHVVRHTEKWGTKDEFSPVEDVSFASQMPRRMSLTQRNAEVSFYA